MVHLDADDALEMTSVEDQQPVETLRTDRSDEAFRDRVRLGRPDGCFHDPNLFAAEHFVERAGVLAVSVADQEAGSLKQPGEAQIPGLLGDPKP